MPLIQTLFQQKYGADGFQVIAIHTGEQVTYAQTVCVENNLTFPMLLDVDNRTNDRYSQAGISTVPFPLGYLVDKNGIIQHIFRDEEPDHAELSANVEALLNP